MILVGGGEVRHRAGELDAVGRIDALGDAQGLALVTRAEPAHPGVELDVHARRTRSRAGRRTPRSTRPPRRRPPARPAAPRALIAPITSIGSSIPPARSSAASCAVATASHERHPERGPRARHRTVAVAVRLDDRAHLRPAAGHAATAATTLRSIAARFTRARARTVIAPGAPRSARAAAPRSRRSRSRLRCRSGSRRPGRQSRARTPPRTRPRTGPALRQVRPDHAREHVARAGGRERGRSAPADADPPVRMRDERVVALQHDDRARLRGGGRARLRAGAPRSPCCPTRAAGRARRRVASGPSRRRGPRGRPDRPACAFSPSASSSSGTCAWRARLRASSNASGRRPSPGPSTSAPAARPARAPPPRRRVWSDPSRSGSGTVITSSSRDSKIRFSDSGTNAVT